MFPWVFVSLSCIHDCTSNFIGRSLRCTGYIQITNFKVLYHFNRKFYCQDRQPLKQTVQLGMNMTLHVPDTFAAVLHHREIYAKHISVFQLMYAIRLLTYQK